MQCDCGHRGERRGNIPRDESTSAAIFDSFRVVQDLVAARWREKKRQKVYKGGCGEELLLGASRSKPESLTSQLSLPTLQSKLIVLEPFLKPVLVRNRFGGTEFYSYRNASAGKIRAADHDG
jgi:hypothetical protein